MTWTQDVGIVLLVWSIVIAVGVRYEIRYWLDWKRKWAACGKQAAR